MLAKPSRVLNRETADLMRTGKSKFLTLESDHRNTPRDATAAVVSWIESLKN